jgi:hypothetical protein
MSSDDTIDASRDGPDGLNDIRKNVAAANKGKGMILLSLQ